MCENPCTTDWGCQLAEVKGMVGQVRKGTHRWGGHQGEEDYVVLEEEANTPTKLKIKNIFGKIKS